jgi:tryptophanyl-tRNA synthetase
LKHDIIRLEMSTQRILTGIKPTGMPHIGNFFGAIQPALSLSSGADSFFFIADYHALTTVKNATQFKLLSSQVAAVWLACGLDPDTVVFYRQSDIPEIFELHWILSCVASKGLLNRAHAYKALVDANTAAKKDPDKNINMGVFNYPILMAADILLFDTTRVPVGGDQKQHVEIARDIAQTFNSVFGEVFVIPECVIQETSQETHAVIVGIDGRKMSKNYDNTIPLFDEERVIKKRIMSIKTGSLGVEAVKDPDTCALFSLFQLFGSSDEINDVRNRYQQGGLAYGELKNVLFDKVLHFFEPSRDRYRYYMSHPQEVDSLLARGATAARVVASETLLRVRHAIGLNSCKDIDLSV